MFQEKGLDAWRAKQNESAAASQDKYCMGQSSATGIVSLCANHAAKNGGGHSRDMKTQACTYAKSSNEGEKAFIENVMARSYSMNFCKYLRSHFDEISWLRMKSFNLHTCYNDVTSNSSESMWYSLEGSRHLNIPKTFQYYLKTMEEKIIALRLNASKQKKSKFEVTREITDDVLFEAIRLHNTSWTAEIVSLDRILTAKVGEKKGNRYWLVTLNPNEKWPASINCKAGDEACTGTDRRGRPCKHAGFVLVYCNALSKNFKDRIKGLDEEFQVQQYHYSRKCWYNEHFHVDTFVKQMNLTIIHYCPFETKSYFVLPGKIKKGKGRSKTRMRKRRKQRPIILEQAMKSPRLEEESQCGLNGLDVTVTLSLDVSMNPHHNSCGLCGRVDHNRSTCEKPSIEYVMNSKPLQKTVQTLSKLPLVAEEILKLLSKETQIPSESLQSVYVAESDGDVDSEEDNQFVSA